MKRRDFLASAALSAGAVSILGQPSSAKTTAKLQLVSFAYRGPDLNGPISIYFLASKTQGKRMLTFSPEASGGTHYFPPSYVESLTVSQPLYFVVPSQDAVNGGPMLDPMAHRTRQVRVWRGSFLSGTAVLKYRVY